MKHIVKNIFMLLIIMSLLLGCSKEVDRENDLATDNEIEVNETDSVDLGEKEDIKSEIYKKYFENFSQSIKYDDNIENNGRMEIEKIDDNRSIFRGNGKYLTFLPKKSQFYIDYIFDSDDFTLSYIAFEGETVNDQFMDENLLVEFIKTKETVNIDQENFDGEQKTVLIFDENDKNEVIESVENLVKNQLFNN